MARRPNYGAEKRQKEIQRQKKKEEKAERKRLRKESGAGDHGEEVPSEAEEPGTVGAGAELDREASDRDSGD